MVTVTAISFFLESDREQLKLDKQGFLAVIQIRCGGTLSLPAMSTKGFSKQPL